MWLFKGLGGLAPQTNYRVEVPDASGDGAQPRLAGLSLTVTDVADVEVAAYLSGGIDSCAVLGLAQRHMHRPIRAFTLSFEDALFDETGHWAAAPAGWGDPDAALGQKQFFAALEECRMRFVPVRHAAAAPHIAEGLYRTGGQVAVTIGRPGSGSANALPGVVGARRGGIPLLAISAEQRRDPVYAMSPAAFQSHDQLDLYRLAVKWSASIRAREQIPEVVRRAFQELVLGRPGPVLLEISSAAMSALGRISPRSTAPTAKPARS